MNKSNKLKIISVSVAFVIVSVSTIYLTKGERVVPVDAVEIQQKTDSSQEKVNMSRINPIEPDIQQRGEEYDKTLKSWEPKIKSKISSNLVNQEKITAHIKKIKSIFNKTNKNGELNELINEYTPENLSSTKALIDLLIKQDETDLALECASYLLQFDPLSKEARAVYADVYKVHVEQVKKNQEKIVSGGNS